MTVAKTGNIKIRMTTLEHLPSDANIDFLIKVLVLYNINYATNVSSIPRSGDYITYYVSS